MAVLVFLACLFGWSIWIWVLLHDMFVAWLIASTMRILWHLPLMFSGDLPWVLGIVGVTAYLSWRHHDSAHDSNPIHDR